ncbi:MAG: hypothetical protein AAF331_05130 [Pseudomonadota bacterium]
MPIRLLWIALAVLLSVGLLSGIYMALETMSPGLDGDAMAKRELYVLATHLHGVALALSLPVAAIGGLTTVLLAERDISLIAKQALYACGFAMVALAFTALAFSQSLQPLVGSVDSVSIPVACAILVGLLLMRHPARNASAFIYLAACLAPAVFYGFAVRLFLNTTDPSFWSDTYIAVAISHIIGFALVLLLFSSLSVWSYARGARLNGWITTGYVSLLIIMMRFYIAAHFAAGLAGMPRRYVDHPEAFAPILESAAWYGFLFAALILFGIGRFFYAVWSRDRSTAADAF